MGKRIISLEKDFMDWRKDDIMYAYLLCLAEYRMQFDGSPLCVEKMLYYDYSEDIMEACGYTSKNSLRNNIKKWIEAGLIEDKVLVDEKGNKLPVYIMKKYFDDEGHKYQSVDLDILSKLSNTKNKHGVQIYVYLLNKFKFRSGYEFTFEELRKVLGYSDKKMSYKGTNNRISDILEDLQRTGYIDYEIKYKTKVSDDGAAVNVPIKVLTFVAEKLEDLPEAKTIRVGA